MGMIKIAVGMASFVALALSSATVHGAEKQLAHGNGPEARLIEVRRQLELIRAGWAREAAELEARHRERASRFAAISDGSDPKLVSMDSHLSGDPGSGSCSASMHRIVLAE